LDIGRKESTITYKKAFFDIMHINLIYGVAYTGYNQPRSMK